MTQPLSLDADTSVARVQGLSQSHKLLTCTVRSPPFSYAHLQLYLNGQDANIDNLQVKAYCAAALRQHLGLTGSAISVDILHIRGSECWVRVPQQNLGAFSAALTAWRGPIADGGGPISLRVRQCTDWLGSLVGTQEQDSLWGV